MKFNLSVESIKYVKILYANSDGCPVSVKAAIKKADENELVTCIKQEEALELQTPQTVTLSIICAEGLYRTKTVLKSCLFNGIYNIFCLETPSNLEFQQNREYFRVLGNYKCVYYVNNNGQTAAFDSETADISANGVSIILPVHVFSEEDSEIELMIEERLITAKIAYVRSEKLDNGYKLSFKFTEISNKDKDYISQVCIKKQLEEKRNKNI